MTTHRLSYLIPLLTVTAMSISQGAVSFAADSSDRLVQKALDLRRSGDDQGAYPILVEAYGQAQAPRAAAQLGFCEQALGRWADAEVHLSEALKASSDPWIHKNYEPIARSLATVKTHVARVEVVGEPLGAEVSINGKVVGTLPLPTPIRVTAGESVVELNKPGYVRSTRTLQLVGGQYQRVLLRAEPDVPKATEPVADVRPPATVSAATDNQGATPERTGETPTDAVPQPTRSDESAGGGGGLRIGAWIAAGASIAFLGVGTFEALSASNKLDAFRTTPDGSGLRTCGTDLPDYGGTICASLHNDWKGARTASLVGLIGGGALAVTSATLFILTMNKRPDNKSLSITCAPEIAGIGVNCLSRF